MAAHRYRHLLPAQLVVAPTVAASGARAPNSTVSVTTACGQELPSWLKFNPESNSFVAAAVPEGGLALSLVVTVDGVSTVINTRALGNAGK